VGWEQTHGGLVKPPDLINGWAGWERTAQSASLANSCMDFQVTSESQEQETDVRPASLTGEGGRYFVHIAD
jgi:hypothetical protein